MGLCCWRFKRAEALPWCLALVVQTLDSAIHWINHSPVDKYLGKQLRYPLDRFLSGGKHYPTFEQPGPGLLAMVIELSGVQFGLKSYAWFWNWTSAQREFDLKSQVLNQYQHLFDQVAGLLKSGIKKAFKSHFIPETEMLQHRAKMVRFKTEMTLFRRWMTRFRREVI